MCTINAVYEQKWRLLFTFLKERKAFVKISECMQLHKTPVYEKIWNCLAIMSFSAQYVWLEVKY